MNTTKPKRKLISGDVGLRSAGSLDISGLRDLAVAHPKQFMRRVGDLIEQRKITIRSIPDLQAFFRAFLNVKVEAEISLGAGERALTDTSAFPLLMGNLVVAAINDAYDAVPTIGEQLVRDMDSNKKFTHVVKMVHNVVSDTSTKEGDEFPMITAGEQFAVIGHKRKGFQLAITQETLDENDLGNFIELIDQGGEFASELIEEQTLSRVFDQNGSAASAAEPYAWHPQGTAASLFSTTATRQTPNGTRIINNPLETTDNIKTARVRLASNLNTRDRRFNIPVSQCKLVVPTALVDAAGLLVGSPMEPGTVNQINNYGPSGAMTIRKDQIVSSSKIDDITTDSWLWGWFEKQYIRKWKIRPETVSVYADAMQYARTREAYRVRIALDVEIGARDNVYVVQSLAGTTAPTASTNNQ